MKERPIIFTSDSVRAILAVRKVQSRRVARFVPLSGEERTSFAFSGVSVGEYCTGVPSSGRVLYVRRGGGTWHQITEPLHCPYGAAGSRLYVKEAFARVWAHADGPSDDDRIEYRADTDARRPGGWDAERDAPKGARWMSPLFMPRALSRITLEILSVRVERVQSISPDDVIAEGVDRVPRCGCEVCSRLGVGQWCPADAGAQILEFATLWDAINGRRPGCSWADNPWCWVLEFRRVEGT